MDIKTSKNTQSYSYSESLIKPTSSSSLFDPYALLAKQCEQEYQEAKKVLDNKITVWQRRLKVYNNQRRDEDAVGDTLLFSTMQTVLASLYDDQLIVNWNPRTEGDTEVAEAYNNLAHHDHRDMKKDVLDYFWDWDTCFFGHSIVYMTNFDRKEKHPQPDLQNPMLFYRDKDAVMINGYPWNNRNACCYFGRWIELTRYEMKERQFFNIEGVRPDKQKSDELERMKQARANATGLTYSDSDIQLGDSYKFPILEWATHWQGEKVVVSLANERKRVVKIQRIMRNGKPADKWPVVDRLMYPTSHDWDGTSIPDIVEDKQRMRAIMKNLAIKHTKSDLYPNYLFDKQRIKNETNLNFGFNKYIGVDAMNGQSVQNAIAPLQKAQFNHAVYNYIMQSLEQDAEKSTATPQMQQGNLNESKRLATELNMVDRNVGTRYSLTAKVFGWSESDFWQQWRMSYMDNFADHIDEKVVRIDSPFGARFKKLTKENLMSDEDPDVEIVSKFVRDAERQRLKQELSQFMGFVSQVPGANVRYGIKKLGGLILDKDELERLIPPTIDERIAERENELLNQDKTVFVNANDDHIAHLEIHARAADTTSAYGHIEAHKRALEIYKSNPNLLPGFDQQQKEKTMQEQGMKDGMAKAKAQIETGGGAPSAPPAGQPTSY